MAWIKDAEIFMDAISIVETRGTSLSNEIIERPKLAKLTQHFLNPFNPTTTISFQLSEASGNTITIFDTLGRVVIELVNSKWSASSYSYNF